MHNKVDHLHTFGLLVTLAVLLGSINFVSGFLLKRKSDMAVYQVLENEEDGSPVLATRSQSTSSSSSSFSIEDEAEHVVEEMMSASQFMAKQPFFKSVDTWMVASILLLICGSGLSYINNIGSICELLLTQSHNNTLPPASPSDIQLARNTHVARFSIASALGRLVIGWLSDRFLASRSSVRKSRLGIEGLVLDERLPFVLFAGSLVTLGIFCCAYIVDNNALLSLITIIVGFGYGCMYTLIPTIVSEWWGTHGFAWRWGWMTWAPGLGAQIINALYGSTVDARGQKCEDGRLCYASALSIAFWMCMTGIVSISLLWIGKRSAL